MDTSSSSSSSSSSGAAGEEKKPEVKTEPKEESTDDKANANSSPVAEKNKKKSMFGSYLKITFMITAYCRYELDINVSYFINIFSIICSFNGNLTWVAIA